MHDQKSYLILFINIGLVRRIVQEPLAEAYLRPYYLFHDGGRSYRNQPIDLQSKLMDWFLYDRDCHERVTFTMELFRKNS